MNDWLGATRHQWNQKRMNGKHGTNANQYDESSLPGIAEMSCRWDAGKKRYGRKHGEPRNRDPLTTVSTRR